MTDDLDLAAFVASFVGSTIQLYALMTPPAALSTFLASTSDHTARERHKIALKASCAIFFLGLALYLFGSQIFDIFGFTIDAFRIGAGVLLFLSAIKVMNEDGSKQRQFEGDISVVPLAIPLSLGPASIGTIIVMGASAVTPVDKIMGGLSIMFAAFFMYLLLLMGDLFGKVIGRTGLVVMSKLTGLILSAIAAQVIFTGVRAFLAVY